MQEQAPLSPPSASSRPKRPLRQRLLPFLRRDLRPRLVSAGVAAALFGGLAWSGVAAFTGMDTPAARDLRVSLRIEHPTAVCDGPEQPACAFDDRQQEAVDRAFLHEQRLRLAVLHELRGRLDRLLGDLSRAQLVVEAQSPASGADPLADGQLRHILFDNIIDLRPLYTHEHDRERQSALQRAAYSVTVDQGRIRQGGREALLGEISAQKLQLGQARAKLDLLLAREPSGAEAPELADTSTQQRQALWAELFNSDPYGRGGEIANWLLADGGQPTVSLALAQLARGRGSELSELIFDPHAPLWRGAFEEVPAALVKPSVRYSSPVSSERQWQLFGALLFGLASFFFVVVGPVATATHTAREREAGTLPVLRMTGLTAGDLALAMALGPNVFASVAGLLLLLLGGLALAFTAGPAALLLPLAILGALGVTTHFTAIGLGDALGHRVNALLVGALMAFGIVVPGLIGGAFVLADIAGAGLLLGPLPPVLAAITELTGLPGTEGAMIAHDPSLGASLLGYSLVVQALLGGACLLSWRRRVEQAWTPLFRPMEGAVLALASVGCSGLALLDLAERVNTQSFDSLNLVTFLASGFLLPLLGWLLVSSLRRPARAASVPSHIEARRAFWRFQAILAVTVGVVAATYQIVMQRSGLYTTGAEVMWATLTQVLLVVETAIGALLLSARSRHGRPRVAMLGGALIILQSVFAALVYRIEGDFVAAHHSAGKPFLLGMSASPYWIGFMILLWGAGLGLILTALLRDRDRAAEEARAARPSDEDEEPRGRWLH